MQSILTSVAVLTSVLLVGVESKGDGMSETPGRPAEATGKSARLDSAVTRELFVKWRTPRSGSANPERMNNPVWEWLVRSKLSAYQATQRFGGPSALKAGPGWCFDRFGQSLTKLPDGRVVLVAGEHEDSYDPDFYIYNDVVVQHPDGTLDIYGYPREKFSPTDFHSATLVSNRLVFIGNLGYPDDRRPGRTPVMVLDLKTFAMTEAKTSGTPPGWIHAHKATLSEDGGSILLQGGKLDRGEDKSLVENIDEWRLRLADWSWQRLTDRCWPQWEVRRKDGGLNHLMAYQQAVWAKRMPSLQKQLIEMNRQFKLPSLEEQLGGLPDLELFPKLYRPSMVHEEVSQSKEGYGVHRIKVEGVVVRYVQAMDSIQVTVEGNLPQPVLDALSADLLGKFCKLECAPCELIKVETKAAEQ
jgi:hypothetical protein